MNDTSKPDKIVSAPKPGDQTNVRVINVGFDQQAYEADKARNAMLFQLKSHFGSNTLPRTILFELTELRGKTPDRPRLYWSARRGWGEEDGLDGLDQKSTEVVNELLDRGTLVRSFEYVRTDKTKLTSVQLPEDVNWGMGNDGFIHMYMLGDGENMQDLVPVLDERHDKAIQLIQSRIDYGTAVIDDREITLSNGLTVSPILFGRDKVLIHKRQLKL